MNENYKNVLITGGCGRLGRQCYYELHNEYNITLLDRVAPDKQPFPWKPEKDCKFVMGELTSLEDCMRAILLSKADCILHLAAITHATEVGRFVYQREPEDLCWDVNMNGTYYLLEAARRLGVKKVIFASSYYATGINHNASGMPWEIPSLPVDENQPCQPQDSYSLSKCLNEKMVSELAYLEMAKVRFDAEITPSEVYLPTGTDNVRFLISANAGEPLAPLSKIASGGELSRTMLALKCALADKEMTPTLIFDEVDTGISGKTSYKIGKKLCDCAKTAQVICVTHSPQIASQADMHIKIAKREENGRTVTSATVLDRAGRIDELARIIGAEKITEKTLTAAAEMLDAAKK